MLKHFVISTEHLLDAAVREMFDHGVNEFIATATRAGFISQLSPTYMPTLTLVTVNVVKLNSFTKQIDHVSAAEFDAAVKAARRV